MNILAIGAHPDDLEISCAGTLAKMKQSGHRVVLCHACTGDKGHYEIPPEELSKIRMQEGQNAGKIIGCEVLSLGFPDCELLSTDWKAKRQFIDAIGYVQPDIVITHAPNDYMPDHTAVSQLVFDCTFLATLPSFSTIHPYVQKVPALYYMDNLAGIDFQPNLYVDITDTLDTKIEMLKQHESQIEWLQEHDGVDIIDFVRTLGKMRGIQAGCTYAEGFIHHMVWTRPNALRFPV